MRRFYANPKDFHDDSVALDPEQSKHMKNVLRLAEGAELRVFDGTGKEFLCEISKIQKSGVSLKIIEEAEPMSPESVLEFTLAAALLKVDKFELVIQKAVELGVTRLAPIVTNRADAKAKNVERKLERWQKIVIESSKQCGRAKLMEIAAPKEFAKFVESAEGTRLLFAEKGGRGFETIKPDKKITAVIGPEGGWDDFELELAKKKDFQIITLGGRVMRAETAAISITALVQSHFGDLN